MAVSTPPVLSGALPVIGHTIEMLRSRDRLFKRGYQELGDLFTLKLGPLNVLVVTGAEYNKQFYTETDKSLTMREGYDFLREAIGEVLFTANTETYYNQRPVLQEAFRRERMVGYIRAMNIEVQDWLDGLGQSGEVDLSAEMLKVTQYVAGRAFVGDDFREELSDVFWKHYEAIGASLDPVLPPNLPLPKFFRRDRARAKLRTIMAGLIAKRRANPDQYNDVVSILINTPCKDGTLIPDDAIVNIFIGLIFAGHETTAGQAAWSLALLMQHPQHLARVRDEIAAHVAAPHESITHQVMSKLEYTYWAIDETTRMHPSADTQLRTVGTPIEIGGYHIPTGWRLMVNATNSHNLSETFSQPGVFDPSRYSPERGEGKNPFAIVGFGGGMHKCTGMNFAKNEMAVIIAKFFQQFDVELLSDDIHVVSGNGANRASAVRVRYSRKA